MNIRASSFPLLFDCARQWYYRYVIGLKSPASIEAHTGTSIHAATAMFDRARHSGETVSLDDSADAFRDAFAHPEEDVERSDEEAHFRDAGAKVTRTYCAEIGSRRIYTEVEVTCDNLELETQSGPVTLSGTSDRVYQSSTGEFRIVDLKSGKRAVSADGSAVTKGHSVQTGIYSLLAEHALGIPMDKSAEIVGLSTANGRIGSGILPDVRSNLPSLIEMAASILKAGIFPPNPRSNLCSRKYCPGWSLCKYK